MPDLNLFGVQRQITSSGELIEEAISDSKITLVDRVVPNSFSEQVLVDQFRLATRD